MIGAVYFRQRFGLLGVSWIESAFRVAVHEIKYQTAGEPENETLPCHKRQAVGKSQA